MILKDCFLWDFISTTFGILIVFGSVEDNFQVIHVPSVDVGINSSNSSDFSANIRWSNVLYIPPTQNQSLKCLELSNSEEFSKHSAKVVTWFRNGHILKNASEFMITDDELTLIVNSRSKALEGKYFCRTEWKNYGIVVSPPLFVEFAGFENHKHEKKQRKVHALRGSIAYVPCVAPRPKPSYAAKYWFVRNDGFTIHESLDDKYFLTLNGLQILISMNNSHDSGNYTCFVKNTITGIEHRGKTVHLLVSEVPKSKSRVKIVAPSQKQTDLWVNIGENITMECVMHGHPSPLVVWEKYGGTLPNSRHEIIFDNLLLTNVSKEDEGTYLCKAEAAPNVDLNEYSSQLPLIFYSLVVHEPIKTKINFEVDLKNEQLYHIQCESSSGSNEMSILFNGEDLLRKSRIVNVNTNEGGRKPRLNVVIHNVSLADGIYQCLTPSKLSKYIPNGGAIFIKRIISNGTTSYRDVFGENYDGYDDDEAKETDNVIQLQQKSDENRNSRLPIIFQKPENATDFVSSTVTFLCQIVGDDVTVSWLKNNRSIVLDHKFDILGSGTLEIKNLDLADIGWYTCVAFNSYGKTTATAFLNVEPLSSSFGSSGESVENTMFIDSEFKNSKELILFANAKVAEFPMSTTTLTSITIGDDDESQLLVDHDEHAVLFNDENDKNLNSPANESLIDENNLQKVKMDAPKVYRLTNTSVMLKWVLPESLSSTQTSVFDLQFRIQYKLVTKKVPWTTIDGILPGNARSFTVQNLTPGMMYKFRIGGFYKNLNFMSGTSSKFLLMAQSAHSLLSKTPTILSVNATSSSTLHVYWMVDSNDSVPVEGFIISYRRVYPVGYASGIHLAQNDTVIGSHKRDYLLQNLLPATPYDIRMCAFNSDGPGHISNSIVQTTKNHHVANSTSDGHFSPLSFGSAAPKPHSNESTKLKDVAFMESWWSVFGLSRDTLAVLIGFITILIIILTIISSIALSVTKRQLKKRGLKNSKKKFSDTSKKIHYEYSFVRSKKKLGNEVATFYAAHVPEYDSLNNLDNINHSENENGGPKDQNTKLLSSSSYSPSNNNEQQKQNYANLYSNPLNDLDHAIVDRQTLPSIYGDISDDYMMHDVIEAPTYVAKDSLLCKSVVEAIASDRASSVASFHSADRNSNFLSAASHNNSYLKSPAILTTRFLTLTTNSSGNNNNPYDFSSNRIYSPHQQQTIATLNQQRAGTLQPKSHFNRTSANNSLSSSSRKHFRSPSPRLPLPVPTPELRSLHYDCLLRSNLNTPSPSKDAQKFDYDSQYSPSQYFKNNCIYDSNIGNTYHSPKIFQNLADSPRSSSSTFRQLKGESGGDGGSPVSTSSKNFGSTFKPPRGDSCVSRNSNNSGILNSYAQIINNSTNQKLTNKTIVAGDDRELESMALYDWSEHILNTSGFGSKGQSEVR